MPLPITLTAPGQPAQVLAVPLSWADVTLAQYIDLFAPADGERRTVAEVLLSLPAGGLNQLAADDVVYLATLLEFSQHPEDIEALLPTPLLPSVGSLPYGILLEAQAHIQADPERPLLAYGPYLLALYRVQLLHGRYDEAKVTACLQALLASPVTECAGDMAHFLGGYKNWLNGTPQTTQTMRKKARKNSMLTRTLRWLKGLGRSSG